MKPQNQPNRARSATLLALFTLLVVACGVSDGDTTGSGVDVVATTTILADVAMNVVGDDGAVEALLPTGADPHDYQASSRQVALIQNADLVLANGLGLEEGLGDVLESAASDGANIVYLGDSLDPIPFGIEAADGDDHGNEDPHVWLDPIRMAEAGRVIAAELELVASSASWNERAGDYAAELLAADQEIQEILAVVPADSRKLVVNHQSLGYFADRYGFEIIGSVVPGGATLGDPSSAELSALVETIEAEGVRAIFAETTEPAALAEAVAAEVGQEVAIVSLYTGSLGEPNSGADTLIGMLKTNADLIAEALS